RGAGALVGAGERIPFPCAGGGDAGSQPAHSAAGPERRGEIVPHRPGRSSPRDVETADASAGSRRLRDCVPAGLRRSRLLPPLLSPLVQEIAARLPARRLAPARL